MDALPAALTSPLPAATARGGAPARDAGAPADDASPSFARELQRTQSTERPAERSAEGDDAAEPQSRAPAREPGREATRAGASRAAPPARGTPPGPRQSRADDDVKADRAARSRRTAEHEPPGADGDGLDAAALLLQSRLPTVVDGPANDTRGDAVAPAAPDIDAAPSDDAPVARALQADAAALAPTVPSAPPVPGAPPPAPAAPPRARAEDLTIDTGRTAAPGRSLSADAQLPTPAGNAAGDPSAAGSGRPAPAAPGLPGPEAQPWMQATGTERAESPTAAAPGAPHETTPPVLPFAAELTRALSASPAAAGPAAPPATEQQLPTPVTAPDFVPRLSSEIAVLARDGVQEARVQLHPVELGPIDVRISVDGQAAQVHLAVDNALTRSLLEQAMPTLAGALRETGLTLAGGGVFEQSRQGGQAGDSSASAPGRNPGPRGDRRDGDDDLSLAASALRRPRATGALDLYA